MEFNEQFLRNLEVVQDRITNACKRHNRNPEEVTLMAVTKTRPASYVDTALDAGLVHIGENRVQEALGKHPEVKKAGFWELIGPLQSNKVRQAIQCVDRIQTVDRIKLVNRLEKTCEELGMSEYPVLLQVNVGEDPAKHGCHAEEAESLVELIQQGKHLRLDGLMTIGEFSQDEQLVRKTFSRLRVLRDKLADSTGLSLDVLSMGMTDDMEWAIAEGSTLVRVGTALFGQRSKVGG